MIKYFAENDINNADDTNDTDDTDDTDDTNHANQCFSFFDWWKSIHIFRQHFLKLSPVQEMVVL